MLVVVAVVIAVAAGIAGTLVALRQIGGSRLDSARRERGLLLDEARRDAEVTRREAGIEAREQAIKLRAELEAELRERRDQVVKVEERVIAKEDDVDRKLSELVRREQGVSDREVHLRQLQEDMKELKDAHKRELERIAGMTSGEAQKRILDDSQEQVRHELAGRVRQMEEEAATEAKRRARNLVADALQRVAASAAAETTVTLVELPSDDMKGRIIGREGRNIRSLEHLTATDIGVVHFRRLMIKEAKALRDGLEPAAAQKPESYRMRSGGAVLSSELSFEEVMKQRFGSKTGKVDA